MSKRRTHSPELKARVAMGAISGHKIIQEIAPDHAIHPIKVNQLKRQLLDGASELFTKRKEGKDTGEIQAKKPSCSNRSASSKCNWSGYKNLSCSDARKQRKLVRSRASRAEHQQAVCASGPAQIRALLEPDAGA
jgi:putative transposase